MSDESVKTMTAEEYGRQVRVLADQILTETGEEPLHSGVDASADFGDGLSVASAALNLIGYARTARMATRLPGRSPYDRQEARVAEFLARRTGIGGGMDPVGFLIASHGYLAHLLGIYRERVGALESQVRVLGATPVLPEMDAVEEAAATRAVAVYSDAIVDAFGVIPVRDDFWADGDRNICLHVAVSADMSPREEQRLKLLVRAAVHAVDAELLNEVQIRCIRAA